MESLRMAHDAEISDMAWSADADWSKFDAVLIGTTWDYQDRFDEFINTLDHIRSQCPLFNPLPLIQWNAHKGYLQDLEQAGASIIPSLWLDDPNPQQVEEAFKVLNCETIVAKRQIGASAEGQHLIHKETPLPPLAHPMLLQPYLPTIETEGEISFIFIGTHFSHAVLKRPAKGDYRIQSAYGGVEHIFKPNTADIECAEQICTLINGQALYARIDMLRDTEGLLRVMEVELIEPYLYPEQCPKLGQRLVQAVKKAI